MAEHPSDKLIDPVSFQDGYTGDMLDACETECTMDSLPYENQVFVPTPYGSMADAWDADIGESVDTMMASDNVDTGAIMHIEPEYFAPIHDDIYHTGIENCDMEEKNAIPIQVVQIKPEPSYEGYPDMDNVQVKCEPDPELDEYDYSGGKQSQSNSYQCGGSQSKQSHSYHYEGAQSKQSHSYHYEGAQSKQSHSYQCGGAQSKQSHSYHYEGAQSKQSQSISNQPHGKKSLKGGKKKMVTKIYQRSILKSKQPQSLSSDVNNATLSSTTCQLCPAQFLSEQKLNLHVNDQHFECPDCPMAFLDEEEYSRHLSQNHPVCTICNQRFIELSDLSDHFSKVHSNVVLSTHGRNKILRPQSDAFHVINNIHDHSEGTLVNSDTLNKMPVCPICGATFLDTMDYSRHAKTHLACRVCGETFKDGDYEGLNDHFKSHVSCHMCSVCLRNNKEFNHHLNKHCHICKELFKTRNELKEHMPTHAFKCYKCNTVYTCRKELNLHKCEFFLVCSLCKNKFDTYGQRNAHKCMAMQSCHCEQCGLILNNHFARKHHPCIFREKEPKMLRTEKSKTCRACSESFDEEVALKEHDCIFFMDQTCKFCDSLFKNEFFFVSHSEFCYNSLRIYRTRQSVICVFCDRHFSTYVKLLQHICMPQKYRCKICKQRYQNPYIMQSHRCGNAAEPPLYECHRCEISQSFKSERDLLKHQQVHGMRSGRPVRKNPGIAKGENSRRQHGNEVSCSRPVWKNPGIAKKGNLRPPREHVTGSEHSSRGNHGIAKEQNSHPQREYVTGSGRLVRKNRGTAKGRPTRRQKRKQEIPTTHVISFNLKKDIMVVHSSPPFTPKCGNRAFHKLKNEILYTKMMKQIFGKMEVRLEKLNDLDDGLKMGMQNFVMTL